MAMRRRSLLGVLGGGLVGVSGCVETTTTVASGCVTRKGEDAPSATEIRDALPDYQGEPVDRDERMRRIEAIIDALGEVSIDAHPWYCYVGHQLTDDGWFTEGGDTIVVIGATCHPQASRYFPDAWGGVPIRIEQTACNAEPANGDAT